MPSGPEQTKKRSDFWSVKFPIALAGLLFLGSIGLAFFDADATRTSADWQNPGVRGDFYGGHIAAGAGLAGTLLLFAAVSMQRNELQLQREELAESRKVARDQAAALSDQEKQLSLQNKLSQRRDAMQTVLSICKISHTAIDAVNGVHLEGLARSGMQVVVEMWQIERNYSVELLAILKGSFNPRAQIRWWQYFDEVTERRATGKRAIQGHDRMIEDYRPLLGLRP